MDINEQIAKHVGLVYQQLARFKLSDDQDAESFAYEALYRAIQTYDSSTGNAFSTYAVCVISNELRNHLRTVNKKRQLDVISYYTPVSTDEAAGLLVDTLKQGEDAEAAVLFGELKSTARHAFIAAYDTLTVTHKKIIIMWYESNYRLTQREIADALHVSQATVSKALSIFKYKIRIELEGYL